MLYVFWQASVGEKNERVNTSSSLKSCSFLLFLLLEKKEEEGESVGARGLVKKSFVVVFPPRAMFHFHVTK